MIAGAASRDQNSRFWFIGIFSGRARAGLIVLALAAGRVFLAATALGAGNPAPPGEGDNREIDEAELALRTGHFDRAQAALDARHRSGRPVGDLPAQSGVRWHVLGARLAAVHNDREKLRYFLGLIANTDADPHFDLYADLPVIHEEWARLKQERATRVANGDRPSAATASSSPGVVSGANPRRESQTYSLFFPFGIGHFAHGANALGAAFLATDSLTLYFSLQSLQGRSASEISSGAVRSRTVLLPGPTAIVAPIAVYGYELNSHLARMRDYSPAIAGNVSRTLGFFPGGVPQFRNNEPTKGLALGAAQGISLLLASSRDDRQLSTLGNVLFVASYAFSVYDGWLHTDRALAETGGGTGHAKAAYTVFPVFDPRAGQRLYLAAALATDF